MNEVIYDKYARTTVIFNNPYIFKGRFFIEDFCIINSQPFYIRDGKLINGEKGCIVGDNFILLSGSEIVSGVFEPTIIKDNVRVSHLCIIGHDSLLMDDVQINNSVTMGGNCIIGSKTIIGLNASIRDGITIGEKCIIGMGSVVTKDIPDNVVAYGNPCKVIDDVDSWKRKMKVGKRRVRNILEGFFS